MIALIEQHRAELAELCRRYRIQQLDLFGSAARGAFDLQASDLDFVVKFKDPGEVGYALRYLHFAESLEKLFHRPVDLLTENMVGEAEFRQIIAPDRQVIYELGSQTAAETRA